MDAPRDTDLCMLAAEGVASRFGAVQTVMAEEVDALIRKTIKKPVRFKRAPHNRSAVLMEIKTDTIEAPGRTIDETVSIELFAQSLSSATREQVRGLQCLFGCGQDDLETHLRRLESLVRIRTSIKGYEHEFAARRSNG